MAWVQPRTCKHPYRRLGASTAHGERQDKEEDSADSLDNSKERTSRAQVHGGTTWWSCTSLKLRIAFTLDSSITVCRQPHTCLSEGCLHRQPVAERFDASPGNEVEITAMSNQPTVLPHIH
jgi:hypothetical protein